MSFLRVLSLLICSFVAITFVSSDREKSGEQILDEYFNSVIEQEELLSQLDEHTIQGNHYDILEISDLLSKKRESQQIQLNQLIQGKWLPVAEEEQSEAYYERILNHLLHKSEDHQVAFHTILWQMQKWWEGRYLSKLHDISIRNMDVAMTTGGALGAAAIAPWHIKAKRGSGFLRGMYRFLPKRYAVLIMYTLPVTLGTSAGVVTAGASNRYGLFLDGIPPSPMHYYGEKIGLAAEVASYNAEDILTDIAHTSTSMLVGWGMMEGLNKLAALGWTGMKKGIPPVGRWADRRAENRERKKTERAERRSRRAQARKERFCAGAKKTMGFLNQSHQMAYLMGKGSQLLGTRVGQFGLWTAGMTAKGAYLALRGAGYFVVSAGKTLINPYFWISMFGSSYVSGLATHWALESGLQFVLARELSRALSQFDRHIKNPDAPASDLVISSLFVQLMIERIPNENRQNGGSTLENRVSSLYNYLSYRQQMAVDEFEFQIDWNLASNFRHDSAVKSYREQINGEGYGEEFLDYYARYQALANERIQLQNHDSELSQSLNANEREDALAALDGKIAEIDQEINRAYPYYDSAAIGRIENAGLLLMVVRAFLRERGAILSMSSIDEMIADEEKFVRLVLRGQELKQ